MKNILITGGCGFLGTNLASEAMTRGYSLVLFDNLSRLGSKENYEWIKKRGNVSFYNGDIRVKSEVECVINQCKPDIIFHLAGQVAMTTSISNPVLDFETNLLGTHNLLETARLNCPEVIVVYSSTNKVYGDLEQFSYIETKTRYECTDKPFGFDENVQLDFHSPYGVSKGSADQYVLDYARIYGLKTVVLRHSSMYGGRQFSSSEQGWVGWFCQKALDTAKGEINSKFTISGNGKQVRDVLHADDMRNLYFSVIDNIQMAAGNAFNIGGGYSNSLSLLELFALLEEHLNIQLSYTEMPSRISDQRVFIADNSKANMMLNWQPMVTAEKGIKDMINWVSTTRF